MSKDKLTAKFMNELARASSRSDMSRDEFTSLFGRTVDAIELETDTLAEICKTSRSTIERWQMGVSAPHRVGRASVFYQLLKVAVRMRSSETAEDAELD